MVSDSLEGAMLDIAKLDIDTIHGVLMNAWRYGARFGNAFTLQALETTLKELYGINPQACGRMLVVGNLPAPREFEDDPAELRAFVPGVILCLFRGAGPKNPCSGLLVRSEGSWAYEVKTFDVNSRDLKGNAYFREGSHGDHENVGAVFSWSYDRGEGGSIGIDHHRWDHMRGWIEHNLGPKV
jgi:hypothetical protein